MLSSAMIDALNNQLKHEAQASFNYLAMASWAEQNKMEGAASFFMSHADEENSHFRKVFNYINEVGAKAKVPSIDQPRHDFDNILQVCQVALDHERLITSHIDTLVNQAIQEKDHATYDFLRFFVEEQMEEEVLFTKVIDRIELIGEGPQSLYYIDKELGKIRGELAAE
jgi:ferritin